MKKDLYYAVNPSGQGLVFISRPERGKRCWVGDMEPCFTMCLMSLESEGLRFPILKWSDEPVKITLSVDL